MRPLFPHGYSAGMLEIRRSRPAASHTPVGNTVVVTVALLDAGLPQFHSAGVRFATP
ncbi:MAG TPA: hypothetical protein VMF06_11245 [Candidatus Limnocylindria bacterium]|nr:hypothetical protein [Candidatus Limnocylindria bacterium]